MDKIDGRLVKTATTYGGRGMTPDYKFYLMGKLRGLERALEIVNRRSADSKTVQWLVREIEELRSKTGEEE